MIVTSHRNLARKKKKLTQGVAAQKLNVSREHLNRVLRGKRSSRSLTTRYNQLLKSYAA